jgi:hypothetical protein
VLAVGNQSFVYNPLSTVTNLTAVNNSAVTSSNNGSIDNYTTGDLQDTTGKTQSIISSEESSSESAGEEMIINAINRLIINLCNKLVDGLGVVKTGSLDGSNTSSEKVAIFAVAAHEVNLTGDPATMKDVNDMKDFYIYMLSLVGILFAIFLVLQQVRPNEAAKIVEMATGQYGYVHTNDLAEYFVYTGGWLLLGPMEFYFALWLNNYLVHGMMLSVLDLVSFTTDNAILYVIMVILWTVLVTFFALRIVTLIVMVRLWFLFGLVLAIKKVRWLGLLIVAYINGIIFYQFVIVWIAVTIVTYVHTHDVGGLSQALLYLGMFLMEVTMTALVALWPLVIAILAPKTWRTVLTVARYSI